MMKARVARRRVTGPHRAFPDQEDRIADAGSGLYARGGCGLVSVPEGPGLWLDAGCWMLDARCWMLGMKKPRIAARLFELRGASA
jgi:hypothetical protein